MTRYATDRAALAAGQFAWDNAEPEIVTRGDEPVDDDESIAADIDAIEFERGW